MLLHFHSGGKSTFHERFLMAEREHKEAWIWISPDPICVFSLMTQLGILPTCSRESMPCIQYAEAHDSKYPKTGMTLWTLTEEGKEEGKIKMLFKGYKTTSLPPSSLMFHHLLPCTSTCWSNAPTCLKASCTQHLAKSWCFSLVTA